MKPPESSAQEAPLAPAKPARRLPQRRYCGAPRLNREGTCQSYAGTRTSHFGWGYCWKHGGNTPSGIKHAQRQMAREAVETYGIEMEGTSPHEALASEVDRTFGHVIWLHQRVRQLEPNELVWGITKESHHSGDGNGGKPFTTTETSAEANIWLRLYQEERRALLEVCRTAIACGIAERQAQLDENVGRMIAMVVLDGLLELGVDIHEDRVRAVIGEKLRMVAGKSA